MQTRRKGESLVEVVVALGIISFVFMGVVNIIAGSITLNVSARQRTEAVAMVQKNLNEYLAQNSNSGACSITGRTMGSSINEIKGIDPATGLGIPDVGCKDRVFTQSTEVCYWLEVADLSTSTPNETFPGYDLSTHNFVKVIAHGKWFTRILGTQEFEVSRLVRNN